MSPARVQQAFRDSLVAGSGEDLQFIGARFGPLDLRFDVLDSPTNYPIDLRAATFLGPVDLRQTTVRQMMRLDKCWFTGGLNASEATFEQGLSVRGARSTGDIKFHNSILDGGGRFDGAEVEGKLGFKNADIRGPIILGDPDEDDGGTLADGRTIVTDTVNLRGAMLDGFVGWKLNAGTLDLFQADVGDFIIRDASLGSFLASLATIGLLGIDGSVVESDTDLSQATVTGRTSVNGRFGGSFRARNARFQEFTAITECVFDDEATFNSTTFKRRTVLRAQARNRLSFKGATFDNTFLLFVSNPMGPMVVDMGRASVPGGALCAVLEPEDSRFTQERRTDDGDQIAESTREPDISFGKWPDDKFDVDLPVYFDLRYATLGDVKLIGCGEGNPLDHFRFLDTDFEQFDFTDYREELRTANWRFHRFRYHSVDFEEDSGGDDSAGPENGDDGADTELASDDDESGPITSEVAIEQELADGGGEGTGPDQDVNETIAEHRARLSEFKEESEPFSTEMDRSRMRFNLNNCNNEFDAAKKESTYQRAKLGAERAGDGIVAAEIFRRELMYRRGAHWNRLRTSESVAGRLRALWAYVTNGLLALTCGYGERPSRVIVTALATIAAFGWVIFPALGPNRTATDPITGIVFSMQAFVSLILGDPTPADGSAVFTLAATTEAFIGAFLIALFVVTLTRSIHR